MFAHLRLFLTTLALLLISSAVWAATFNVSVGGSHNVFSPSTLTITSGDFVTFTNAGGFHNVVSTDTSPNFRCANGCDGVDGGNGNPADPPWSFSIQLMNGNSVPITIHYFCEVHQAMGMVGSITINPAPAQSLHLGGYLSGNWFNPAQGGHGFQLELTNQPDSVITTEKEMVAIWFVYTPDGTGQNWIFGQGPYDSTKNTVTLPAAIFHGPKFPFPLSNYDPNAVQGNLGDWGTMTFTFSDCNNGTASWASTASGYGSGTMPITRLTSIQGTSCP